MSMAASTFAGCKGNPCLPRRHPIAKVFSSEALIPHNLSLLKSAMTPYTKIAQFKTPQQFLDHLASLGIEMPT